MAKIDKARFWTGVLYPENMREDWQESIGDILQYPYAYCVHNRDLDGKNEHRKDHLHLIIAFPNTTTYNHALNVMDLLSVDGKSAINTCEAVIGIRNVYDYLIHDTDDCRKKGKVLYDSLERITGNNFDIGSYEQLDAAEKNEIFIQLSEAIRENDITNYMDFYAFVVDTYDEMKYIEVLRTHSGHFERLTTGNYHRLERLQWSNRPSQAQRSQHHENSTKTPRKCCPICGSAEVIKSGKTLGNTQRWECKECGKRFV